jgi:hypothetical protein
MIRKMIACLLCLTLLLSSGFVGKPTGASAATGPWNLLNDNLDMYTNGWDNFGTGLGTVTQGDGEVTVLDQGDFARYLLKKSFTAPVGAFSFEVRAKVGAPDTLNEFTVRSANYLISFYLTYGTTGMVQSNASSPAKTYTLDTTVYHTYRIVAHADYTYDLYVDGVQAWSRAPKLGGTGTNALKIGGDTWSRANLVLDYIRLGSGEVLPEEAAIVSITPVTVSTRPGTIPILPDTVTAIYNDESSRSVAVVWDSINPAAYAEVGNFQVRGDVAGTSIRASGEVAVTASHADITGIGDVYVQTNVLTPPTLPSVVDVVYSDDSVGTLPVVWDSITPSQYAQTGNFDILGSVNGTAIRAVAHVTVLAVPDDEFDMLRKRLKTMLTGGGAYNPADPDIAAQIVALTTKAQNHWDRMEKSSGRTYLWSDLASATISAQITSAYTRLKEMAIAYSTPESGLYKSSNLRTDINGALDWMYDRRYNERVTRYDNWWDWWIGAPIALNETVVLMYDDLSADRITKYMTAVNKFTPIVDMTAANRAWQSQVVSVRGIIVKDAAKIALARDGLSNVLDYVSSSDGFYKDGSFIQHEFIAYSGGYGATMMVTLSDLLYLLSSSTWEVTDSKVSNVYQWVYDTFEPVMYKGLVMDMTRGREISRSYATDHLAGRRVIQSVLRLSQMAPPEHAANFASLAKYWITSDEYSNFYLNTPLTYIILGKEITGDSSIVSRGEPNGFWQFANMDEAVLRRPDFSWALKMFSNRTANYEAANGENLKGWHTGDGMTYLYNGDLGQYSDDFWPTVDPYRLPGTTVDTLVRTDGQGGAKRGKYNWVGGTEIQDKYGVSGMQLDGLFSTLTAKKSWFAFDDEIVSLGAGITSTDSRTIETIVENRKIAGTNAFTVNGTAKPNTLGWAETMNEVNWAHLQGSVPNSDIGYYFPEATTVNGLREARNGKYTDIDRRTGTLETPITSNYLTMWFDHGANPKDGTYEYVTLPKFTSEETQAYSNHPDVTVLVNTPNVQAVKENGLNIVGANFWNKAQATVQIDGKAWISSSGQTSVMTRETSSNLEVSVADPTHVNTGTIDIEINAAATGLISADPGVTVKQLSPVIQLSVQTAGAAGATFHANFNFVPTTDKPAAPQITAARAGDGSATIQWNGLLDAKGYYVKYGTESGHYTHVIPLALASEFRVPGLENGKMYYFAVSAYNGNGEGPVSSELTATPIATSANWDLLEDDMSNFSAGWFAQGTAAGAVTQKDGFVTVLDQGDRSYYLIKNDLVLPAGAFTFEATAKVGAAGTMNEFSVRSANYLISFYLTYGSEGTLQNVSSNPSKVFKLDTTVYHAYTAVVHPDYTYDLYVDGKLAWAGARSLGSGSSLIKIGGDTAAIASVDLDHFRVGIGEIAPPAAIAKSVATVQIDTLAGEGPILPNSVSVTYDNGLTEMLPVLWDGLDPSKYAQQGIFTVEGAVLGTELHALAQVTVTAVAVMIADIEPVQATTTAGTPPHLPLNVEVVYSDESTGSLPVLWDSIAPSQYAQAGTFSVNGHVNGTSLLARADVTVQALPSGGSDSGGGTPDTDTDSGTGTGAGTVEPATPKATTIPVERTDLSMKTEQTIGEGKIYRVGAEFDGQPVNYPADSSLHVTVPYKLKPGEDSQKLIVSYIDAEGHLQVVVNGVYNPDTGLMEFKASQAGDYAIYYREVSFNDTDSLDWAKASIEALAARDIIQGIGEGSFSPERPVSRAEFVSMLMRMFGLSEAASGSVEFADVRPGDWYYGLVAAAQSLGIVNGTPDGSFGSNEEISRQDMAVIVQRTLDALKIKPTMKGGQPQFGDYADISDYATKAVSLMQSAGILEGSGDSFHPQASTTRAEAAVMLVRMLGYTR